MLTAVTDAPRTGTGRGQRPRHRRGRATGDRVRPAHRGRRSDVRDPHRAPRRRGEPHGRSGGLARCCAGTGTAQAMLIGGESLDAARARRSAGWPAGWRPCRGARLGLRAGRTCPAQPGLRQEGAERPGQRRPHQGFRGVLGQRRRRGRAACPRREAPATVPGTVARYETSSLRLHSRRQLRPASPTRSAGQPSSGVRVSLRRRAARRRRTCAAGPAELSQDVLPGRRVKRVSWQGDQLAQDRHQRSVLPGEPA